MPSNTEPTSDDPLRITIVGGGIAGLAAATALRSPSHLITVHERNGPDVLEFGAAVALGPNGIKMVRSMGLTRDDVNGVLCGGYKAFSHQGKPLHGRPWVSESGSPVDWWLVHRQDLKDALLRSATSPSGSGSPATIVYGARVIDVDAHSGKVMFADGAVVEADLVIGADGIHSEARAAVVQDPHPAPLPSGHSMYRFVLPFKLFQDDAGGLPEQLDYSNGVHLTLLVAQDGTDRNVVIYPCRSMKLLNIACAVPDKKLKHETTYSWTAAGIVDDMVDLFQGFPEWLLNAFQKTNEVKLFQLRDQEPLPRYARGRTCLIGDAAHAMVPYQGQGVNQALEDAEGLGVLLKNVKDKDEIPGVLELWERARKPRASEIQLGSRLAQQRLAPETFARMMRIHWRYEGIRSALPDNWERHVGRDEKEMEGDVEKAALGFERNGCVEA
ncbi:hypothetical protein QBC46DRAFT_268198 [Diplogelasinospora grovesii]|uniref:FAD-binding domain-containing protein n=1 Tax=Diplogelasinospora grovesii TaxID=303347 RepID=A0AAN6N150_9PEZI|nr:hypothetical protein QBC46DRAFT_268198 [Diplogelasinospora grovesii]